MFSNSKFSKEKKAAFTLIEMLIVISIIGILTSLFIGSYQGSIQHSRLESSTEEIKSVYLALKSQASNGLKSNDESQTALCTGLHFDLNQDDPITSFQSKYDSANKTCLKEKSSWIKSETVVIYPDVEIAKLAEESIQDLTIYFLPPRGEIQIWHSGDSLELQEEMQIILKHQQYDDFTRSITVNPRTARIE